ncbi:hypothetical protein C8A01DRAFT_34947 [Parachaetomium inaequale]|uniref:Uncharacterized protein n=1 Tax=Parachaetomium inaequale TaxID=2588326 RepID=A0AAN6PI07_9PEZI|nr:hypothetical protein C8A01DRAFT_34947 [Parachaetomium inaequale]
MCQPPTNDVVREMLGLVVPEDVTVKKVQLAPSVRPPRTYEVLLSDGRTLHLVLPPISMWRPLRAEQGMLTSEAITVRWLSDTLAREDSATAEQNAPSSSSKPDLATSLLPLLPTLLRHGQETHLANSSFAVYDPVSGAPLSLFSPEPSLSTQREIDRQLGALFRNLAAITSPTGRFGPLAAVVDTKTPQPAAGPSQGKAPKLPKVLIEGGLSVTGGAGTWSVAFHSMLEGVLRDGEDMAVLISYPTIRRHFRRLGYLLDEVTTGRLVVVEGAGRGNVLVEGTEVGEQQQQEQQQRRDGEEQEEDVEDPEGGEEAVKDEERAGKEADSAEKGESKTTTIHQKDDTQPQQTPKLTGLRDWSSAVFGDPLLATIFSDPHQQPPSAAFLEGFNDEKLDPDPRHTHLPYPLNRAIIEGVDTAWIRLLFYQAYHAVARIVSEFYRPRQDSSARELEARRKLNEVLAKLAEVPDDSKKKHQRPSGEMSPAKRLRGAEDR